METLALVVWLLQVRYRSRVTVDGSTADDRHRSVSQEQERCGTQEGTGAQEGWWIDEVHHCQFGDIVSKIEIVRR